MDKDNSKRRRKKAKMNVEDGLRSDFSELTIDEAQSFIPLAVNEYYYSLGLNDVEMKIHMTATAVVTEKVSESVPADSVRESPKKKKKREKKEDRVVEKVEGLTGKLKSLTVTVQNDQRKVSSPKKTKEKDTKNLLEQLKMLQSGRITSENIVASHESPPRAPKASEDTAEEKLEALVNSVGNSPISAIRKQALSSQQPPAQLRTSKNKDQTRAEIEALNRMIQEKIGRARPRLEAILNSNASPSSSNAAPLLPKQKVPLTAPSNFAISTTRVGDNDIYRYSSNQISQLQQFGTWQHVPRLLQLKICGTQLCPLDEFLMRLVNAPSDERNELILNKAQERNFISRSGPSDYAFLSPNFNATENEPAPQTAASSGGSSSRSADLKTLQPIPDYIERFRVIARSDDELNSLIYQHEFNVLFESALKNLDRTNISFEDLINFLVETKQAYLIEGEIRVNQRNNQEAYVSHPKGMRDVCVSKLILRRHAFHGDIVRVLVKIDSDNGVSSANEQETQNTPDIIDDLIEEAPMANRNFGCVLDILEQRHSRRVLGTFAPFTNIKKTRKYLMVNIRDTRVPSVRVSTRTGIPTDTELSDKLVIAVEVTGWCYDQPQGKVVSIIGKKGLLKTENVAILQQNNLDPQPFEQKILDQLPNEPFVIPPQEFEYREDLRKKCIFSIDPETARDLDDALSCEALPNGNFEVGVHISDVSYFVKEDSDLDKIVRETATTIYLVDTVYHMLPEKLCLMCSLLPGADKMAYSVFFEMHPSTAAIVNVRYTRSIVNSCGKLSYDHAQMVIDKKDRNWSSLESEFPELFNGFTVAQVADVIDKLQALAVIMRANRKANGALKIDQPKLSFQFAKGDQRMEAPVSFSKYCTKDSNRLIEEFMLLANISVATFINQRYPEVSLLRHHDTPSESAMKKLVKVLNKHGIQLDTSSSAALSKSMESLITFAKHPSGMNAAINLMVSKTMSRAKYFCNSFGEEESDFWHYALSIPIYTHFTSPIRRYADILVHRVLNAALNYEPLTTKSPDEVQKLAEICNAQKYNAKLAGDDSSSLYFMHFIQSLKSKTMPAAVLGIFEFNLEVVLIDTGHVIKVYYKNLQQADEVVIKTFIDNSPPYATFHLPKLRSSMKVEFGMEILVQLEVFKDKLIVNKIFYT